MARRLVLRLVVVVGPWTLGDGSAPRETPSDHRGFGSSLSSARSRFPGAPLMAAGHYGLDSKISRRECVPFAVRGRGRSARFQGGPAASHPVGGGPGCV